MITTEISDYYHIRSPITELHRQSSRKCIRVSLFDHDYFFQ